jgi:alpha-beta hydrolase superfamily lysophospholipase
MQKNIESFIAKDKKEIFYYKWTPDNKDDVKAVIQIAHGMAEHAQRYGDFADYFTGKGFAVYANDHRGHGKTAGSLEEVGFIAEKDGWDLLIKDFRELSDIIKSEYPGKPLILLGHSMGALVIEDYMFTYGNEINGAVLSGTSADPGFMGKIGKIICSIELKRKGARAKSPLLDKLSFGKFNTYFKPNRTPFDWLSTNEKNVDRYINDPYCGDIFSAGFFKDLLYGVGKINKFKNIQKVPKKLPILLISGALCPVGNFKKGVMKVYESYKKAGIKDLDVRFYEGMRHEILNEKDNLRVYKDIEDWTNRIID